MAGWDSYTQKSTPADADTLMIKDTSGGANKRTPFSGVWNWILTKLTNAVISQLETTNKSIIPAINELNSKNIFYGTAINSNDDMNDYTVPGIYYSSSSTVTQTLKNTPPEDIPYGFSMLVLPTSSKNGTIAQVIIRGVTAEAIYARSQNTSQWYQWRKYSGSIMS